MITAVYNRKKNRLVLKGHAQSGEEGHDLVCASASILAYTLASNVRNMASAGQVFSPVIKLEKGDAVVKCKAGSYYKAVVTLVFDSVCQGFELLAKGYPENISYTIEE